MSRKSRIVRNIIDIDDEDIENLEKEEQRVREPEREYIPHDLPLDEKINSALLEIKLEKRLGKDSKRMKKLYPEPESNHHK